ncbi:MAG: HEAT repeat domain-containing protein [Myxococcota bacterium]|nr:HEAT repeat domain-containing protein [Myxococcota bacterium]
MLTTLLLLCSLAVAGLDADLERAANGDLSEAMRREAFNSLTRSYSTERPQMEAVLFDQKADARQRWVLARSLGHTGSKDAMRALLKLCEDPMPAMRAAAAGGLGDLGFKDASPKVASLLEDDAIMVRGEAAIALGKIGDHASAPALEAALRDRSNFYRDQSLWVRVHYVTALGQIGAPSSTAVLIAALEDQDRAVQDAALAALREAEGFDFAEGRTRSEHIQAWQRWYAAQDR